MLQQLKWQISFTFKHLTDFTKGQYNKNKPENLLAVFVSLVPDLNVELSSLKAFETK